MVEITFSCHHLAEIPWNAITYLDPRACKRNTLLKTIPKFSYTYSVTFDFKPKAFQKGWTNVIHLTTGGNRGKHGERIPSVWFFSSSSTATENKVRICSSVNNDVNYCLDSGVFIPRGKWTSFSITQVREGTSYRYTVNVGGVQLGSVINKEPREFSNVKVYASDDWFETAQGSISNLIIIPNLNGNFLVWNLIYLSLSFSLYYSSAKKENEQLTFFCKTLQTFTQINLDWKKFQAPVNVPISFEHSLTKRSIPQNLASEIRE